MIHNYHYGPEGKYNHQEHTWGEEYDEEFYEVISESKEYRELFDETGVKFITQFISIDYDVRDNIIVIYYEWNGSRGRDIIAILYKIPKEDYDKCKEKIDKGHDVKKCIKELLKGRNYKKHLSLEDYGEIRREQDEQL